jgi:endonuclease/exonuclease/phosphatase family metal-dependent hydrolase
MSADTVATPPRPSLLRRLGRLFRWGATPAGWAGLATLLWRWGPSDYWNIGVVPTYAPALLVLPATVAAFAMAKGSRRLRLGAAAVAVIAGLAGLVQEQPRAFGIGGAPKGESSARIAFHNVMSFRGGTRPLMEPLLAVEPDVIVLAEATQSGRLPEDLDRVLRRGWREVSGRRAAVLTRLPLADGQRIPTGKNLVVFRALVAIRGIDVAIYQVDLNTPLRRDTVEAYRELAEILAAEDGPHIVIGDFNTPRQSAQLRRTFRGYADALAAAAPAGTWLATWPEPLPLWQIDHAFLSPGLAPAEATLVRSMRSDHSGFVIGVRVE